MSVIPFMHAKALHLPPHAMAHFARLLDGLAGRPAGELDLVTVGPHCRIPALLVHDRDDAVIPYREAEILAAVWPALKMISTAGLGHRDILADDPVVQAIADFVAGDAR
jgi:pimeloyl-ACP methyl ester carboxylesterase